MPLGFLLWLIGVPSAPLWGLLAIVLRYIPYIGPVLAAGFPLFLAFAVAPGWSMLLWTAGLFITLELISNNIVEPWLYGSRTGVTPLAINVSAIFWAWIRGPMGLVLSSPLTACLVVIGRHVPQFEFFSILFGDEPVLAPEAQVYQRLLAGDTAEATTRATEATAEDYLADYHQDVTIPALAMAERDRRRGVLTAEQEARYAEATTALLDQLDLVIEAELDSAQSGDGAGAGATATDGPATGSGAEAVPAEAAPADRAPALEPGGRKLVLVGGRSGLDDLLARMLLQAAEAEGAAATQISRLTLLGAEQAAVAGLGAECAVLVFLSGQASRASLLQARAGSSAGSRAPALASSFGKTPAMRRPSPWTRPAERGRAGLWTLPRWGSTSRRGPSMSFLPPCRAPSRRARFPALPSPPGRARARGPGARHERLPDRVAQIGRAARNRKDATRLRPDIKRCLGMTPAPDCANCQNGGSDDHEKRHRQGPRRGGRGPRQRQVRRRHGCPDRRGREGQGRTHRRHRP